jgi:hypothetical protein
VLASQNLLFLQAFNVFISAIFELATLEFSPEFKLVDAALRLQSVAAWLDSRPSKK